MRPLTGNSWRPRRPLPGRGYLAGEHASRVRSAERRLAVVLAQQLAPLLPDLPSDYALLADARMCLRVARTHARTANWLRQHLSRRLGAPAPHPVWRAIFRALVEERYRIRRPSWRHADIARFHRFQPERLLAGPHRLVWMATEPPWPRA